MFLFPRDDSSERSGTGSPVPALQRAYADAILQGDEAVAERVIREAIDAELGVARISDEIVAPSMRLVGEMWASGTLSVAEEHLATQITLRVLALLRESYRATSRRVGRRVLLAALEGEQHVLGLEMVANLLTQAGYDVRMLGADVPLDELATAVRRHRPVAVGLTATLPATTSLVGPAIAYVRREAPTVGIVVGGAGAFERLAAMPGVRICEHVSDAVEIVDGLAHSAALN